MALDGIFLRHLKNEIYEKAIGSRVDKIYQPNKEEIILAMRNRESSFKLLISSRANSARLNFTEHLIENPSSPPMLCMLFRKKLIGSKLKNIRQPGLERVLFLDFEITDPFYETKKLSLVIEIMGKHSNIILIDETNTIIDSIKRVDAQMSSIRLILPGVKYKLPPKQDKLCLLDHSTEDIIKILKKKTEDYNNKPISKILLESIQGISPIVCREIEYLIIGENQCVNFSDSQNFYDLIAMLTDLCKSASGNPYMVIDKNDKPIDFSFLDIKHYENLAATVKKESFSKLLDEFYFIKDRIDRMRALSQDLNKILANISERITRKINIQRSELEQSVKRDDFKIYGDILNANLYKVQKGITNIVLENFYNNMSPVKIKLDPSLTASENAQNYYKNYKKAKNAEIKLKVQIEKSIAELNYIDSVIDSLSRSGTREEIEAIREELSEQGYIKRKRIKKPYKLSAYKPLEFKSSRGFKIIVGRNNIQNDKITFKQAKNNDIWFHVKDVAGSHTIILTEGKIPDEMSILQAARIAAFHSKAGKSSNVPVDYTMIKYVTKPKGAKPGMVIYKNYKTLYVDPCDINF